MHNYSKIKYSFPFFLINYAVCNRLDIDAKQVAYLCILLAIENYNNFVVSLIFEEILIEFCYFL